MNSTNTTALPDSSLSTAYQTLLDMTNNGSTTAAPLTGTDFPNIVQDVTNNDSMSSTALPDQGLSSTDKGLLALGIIGFILLVLLAGALWYLWRRFVHLKARAVVVECQLREIKHSSQYSTSTTSRPESGGPSRTTSTVVEPPITKTSVQLWGRQATIVGSPKNLSQVYSASQDYFAREANFSVPSKRLTIFSQHFISELLDGQLPAEPLSPSSQRPTSFIQLAGLAGIEEDAAQSQPVSFVGQKEIFKHKRMDKSGGTLEVSGIRLEVPPGALDKEIELSIGITWDTAKYPKLSPKRALLSPVVICEPHGTTFTKPVKLSFPHCARDSLKDWVPTIMCSQQRIDSTRRSWNSMGIGEYQQRTFGNKTVTIDIQHFTLYALAGEAKEGKQVAKDIKILAFAPPLKLGDLYKVRIYCVENYDKEIGEIDKDEVLLGGRRIHPRKSLLFHDTGENLCVENNFISEGWQLLRDKTAELSFERIWHGLTPNHEFAFNAESNVSLFDSMFVAYQKGYNDQCLKLNISDKEAQTTNPWEPSTGQIPLTLRQRLVVLLQPTVVSGNDWRMVGEKLDLELTEIQYLESTESPVDFVLNKWESKRQSLKKLRQLMLDIQRDDAATEINEHLSATRNSTA